VSRALPLQRIVAANSDEIVLAVQGLLARATAGEEAGAGAGAGTSCASSAASSAASGLPRQYRFEIRSRNNSGFDKTACATAIYTSMVGAGWRRDEAHGRLVVLVEVFKIYAGVSVLSAAEWDRYCRYNIRLCAEREEDRAARLAKAAAAQATGGQDGDFDSSEEEGEGEQGGAEPVGGAMEGAQAWVPGAAAKRPRPADAPPPPPPAPAAPLVQAASAGSAGGGGGASSAHRTYTPVHDAAARRFYIPAEQLPTQTAAAAAAAAAAADDQEEERGEGAPYLAYDLLQPDAAAGGGGGAGPVVVITHTYTPPSLRGRGLAKALCDAAFAWAAGGGGAPPRAVRPDCSYVSDSFAPALVQAGGWRWDGALLRPTA
jgi:hypothetical protein